MMTRLPGRRRLLLAGTVSLAALAAGPLMPHDTNAQTTVCRTDPLVMLSNGYKLGITATMSTRAADVRTITYTVHIPVGTTVDHVVFTGGPFSSKERLVIKADGASDIYDTDTVVYTHTSDIAVTATSSVKNGMDAAKTQGTVQGKSGQHLPVHLHS